MGAYWNLVGYVGIQLRFQIKVWSLVWGPRACFCFFKYAAFSQIAFSQIAFSQIAFSQIAFSQMAFSQIAFWVCCL